MVNAQLINQQRLQANRLGNVNSAMQPNQQQQQIAKQRILLQDIQANRMNVNPNIQSIQPGQQQSANVRTKAALPPPPYPGPPPPYPGNQTQNDGEQVS